MTMDESMNMSVSEMIKKDGQKTVYVLFTDKNRSAELRLPEGKVMNSAGFEEEELAALELYVQANAESIYEMAKKVNVMDAFLKS